VTRYLEYSLIDCGRHILPAESIQRFNYHLVVVILEGEQELPLPFGLLGLDEGLLI